MRPGDLFTESNRMFEEAEHRRTSFLKDMEVSTEANGTQCWSYSSSSFRSGNSEPVTQRTESFRGPDGNAVSRTFRSIGDKTVEETVKGDETTRSLHNLNESELQAFDEQIASHKSNLGSFFAPRALTQQPGHVQESQAALPAALEQDLAGLKNRM